jgi:quinol monooxygenase YgiN
MSVTVVATIVPLAEHKDAVRQALLDTIPRVHAEDGCQLYALQENDDRFVMVEQWATPEALQLHTTAPAFTELGPRLTDRLAGPLDIAVLVPVVTGDPGKGQLRG